MVRGVSRQIVVVRPQHSDVFEQAIFILKDDLSKTRAMRAEDILKEACKTASRFSKARRLPRLVSTSNTESRS